MNLRTTKRNNALRQNPGIYPETLTFFPLSPNDPKDLCQNISKNLFELEKELAFFSFAIQEIKDITHFSAD